MQLCSNKTLFTDTEIWILCNFHVSWNTILLCIFFSYLNMWKPFLVCRPYRNGQQVLVCWTLICAHIHTRYIYLFIFKEKFLVFVFPPPSLLPDVFSSGLEGKVIFLIKFILFYFFHYHLSPVPSSTSTHDPPYPPQSPHCFL